MIDAGGKREKREREEGIGLAVWTQKRSATDVATTPAMPNEAPSGDEEAAGARLP